MHSSQNLIKILQKSSIDLKNSSSSALCGQWEDVCLKKIWKSSVSLLETLVDWYFQTIAYMMSSLTSRKNKWASGMLWYLNTWLQFLESLLKFLFQLLTQSDTHGFLNKSWVWKDQLASAEIQAQQKLLQFIRVSVNLIVRNFKHWISTCHQGHQQLISNSHSMKTSIRKHSNNMVRNQLEREWLCSLMIWICQRLMYTVPNNHWLSVYSLLVDCSSTIKPKMISN